jgi:hypothetical protein
MSKPQKSKRDRGREHAEKYLDAPPKHAPMLGSVPVVYVDGKRRKAVYVRLDGSKWRG